MGARSTPFDTMPHAESDQDAMRANISRLLSDDAIRDVEGRASEFERRYGAEARGDAHVFRARAQAGVVPEGLSACRAVFIYSIVSS